MAKLDVISYKSEAEGELIKEPKLGYRFIRIRIRPTLEVAVGHESRAEQILEKAHQLCLIARSLNCPVEIEPRVVAL
jgi:organic hydroperoxide reductase OsmC/OhrA